MIAGLSVKKCTVFSVDADAVLMFLPVLRQCQPHQGGKKKFSTVFTGFY